MSTFIPSFDEVQEVWFNTRTYIFPVILGMSAAVYRILVSSIILKANALIITLCLSGLFGFLASLIVVEPAQLTYVIIWVFSLLGIDIVKFWK